MAMFAQYAMAASHEALEDAGWYPQNNDEQEMTVRPTNSVVRLCIESKLRASVLALELAVLKTCTTHPLPTTKV